MSVSRYSPVRPMLHFSADMGADLTPKHKLTNKKAGILNNRSLVPRIHIALKCNICPPYEGIEVR